MIAFMQPRANPEVHGDPGHALVDGAQLLSTGRFEYLTGELRLIAPAAGRSLA